MLSPELHERADDLVHVLQPSRSSDEHRAVVVSHISKLIYDNVGAHVYQFGSVPLKTYLPDADIDIGCFVKGSSTDASWLTKLQQVLVTESSRKHPRPQLQVSNVIYVNAEVKVLKCFIGEVAVDISANQIGGLCSLCFFDAVDQTIGQDHLFKRSILLVKAWCSYQSRVLGSHTGLFSTYAVQTIVLHLFVRYGSLIKTPLDLFVTFLDFVSSFPWDSHICTIMGTLSFNELENGCIPPLGSLKSLTPCGGDPLIEKDALIELCQKYNVLEIGSKSLKDPGNSTRAAVTRPFLLKAMNISDPLNPDNNLGRSVSFANANRIRTALRRGLLTLNQIASIDKLGLPKCISVVSLFDLFFKGVWDNIPKDRYLDHSQRKREELASPVSRFGSPESVVSSINHSASQIGFALPRVQTAPPQINSNNTMVDSNDPSSGSKSCLTSPIGTQKTFASAVATNVKKVLAPEPKVAKRPHLDNLLLNSFELFSNRPYDPFSSGVFNISTQLTQALMVHGFSKRHEGEGQKSQSLQLNNAEIPATNPKVQRDGQSRSVDPTRTEISRDNRSRKESNPRRGGKNWTEKKDRAPRERSDRDRKREGRRRNQGERRSRHGSAGKKQKAEEVVDVKLCLDSVEQFPPLKK
ncbi:hypothetical protein P9112_002575 [Eukaryota sp. TZLM1-RC]